MISRGLDPIGTGRQIELVARGLVAAGCEVAWAATTAGGSLGGRLEALGCSLHRIGSRPATDLAAAARLVHLARRLQPRAVLAWGRSQLALAAAVRIALPRTQAIGTVAMPPRGARDAWAARGLDRLVVSTPPLAAAWRRQGVPAARMSTVLPGIESDTGPFRSRAELARHLGLDPAKIWTLCVAPLESAARLERLVWAIDQLGVVRRDLEHVLVGAGPLERQIRRRAVVQHLAERLFVVPHCDCVGDLLGEVRFVWQSGAVALGGALLDALARGVPTVAVDDPATRQFVTDGETGRIVPADPESEFPRRAFGIVEDDELARRYGEAARSRAAAAFPVAALVQAHRDVLEQ